MVLAGLLRFGIPDSHWWCSCRFWSACWTYVVLNKYWPAKIIQLKTAGFLSLDIKKASQKVFPWIWTKQGAGITHHGVLRNERTRDHLSQQRENSCVPWFVHFLQEAHLIFPAQSIWIHCFLEEVDFFLSRKISMQGFSKYRVSRILDTKDLNRRNALGGIFEDATHRTNLELPCFYVRLWGLFSRLALVFSRKCKLLATSFYLFQ